jgi:hypothetical protein
MFAGKIVRRLAYRLPLRKGNRDMPMKNPLHFGPHRQARMSRAAEPDSQACGGDPGRDAPGPEQHRQREGGHQRRHGDPLGKGIWRNRERTLSHGPLLFASPRHETVPLVCVEMCELSELGEVAKNISAKSAISPPFSCAARRSFADQGHFCSVGPATNGTIAPP